MRAIGYKCVYLKIKSDEPSKDIELEGKNGYIIRIFFVNWWWFWCNVRIGILRKNIIVGVTWFLTRQKNDLEL